MTDLWVLEVWRINDPSWRQKWDKSIHNKSSYSTLEEIIPIAKNVVQISSWSAVCHYIYRLRNLCTGDIVMCDIL